MDRKTWRTQQKPQILIKQTFDRTKKFFQKTFRNLKSFLQGDYQKPPSPLPRIIFPHNKRINHKVRDLDSLYKSFSEKDHSTNEEFKKMEETFVPPKEQINADEEDYKSEDLKEEKRASTKFGSKREKESSLMAANALAQKMKELEMMDVNDVDHVLDIEEVIHYYSRLTCSTYQEMVDKFFVDMYLEYNVNPPPLKSRNNSMRKLGSASVHSSMRSLGPIKM